MAPPLFIPNNAQQRCTALAPSVACTQRAIYVLSLRRLLCTSFEWAPHCHDGDCSAQRVCVCVDDGSGGPSNVARACLRVCSVACVHLPYRIWHSAHQTNGITMMMPMLLLLMMTKLTAIVCFVSVDTCEHKFTYCMGGPATAGRPRRMCARCVSTHTIHIHQPFRIQRAREAVRLMRKSCRRRLPRLSSHCGRLVIVSTQPARPPPVCPRISRRSTIRNTSANGPQRHSFALHIIR